MNSRLLWSRILIVVGAVAMLLGTLDPLEGSLLILPGSGLIALGMFLRRSHAQRAPLLGVGIHPDSGRRWRDVRAERVRRHRRQERAFDVVGNPLAAVSGGLAHGVGWRHCRSSSALQVEGTDCARFEGGLRPGGFNSPPGGLLPDAELAEDQVQQVFGGGLADDFADGIDGDAQVQRDEFQGLILRAARPGCAAWRRGRG